MEVCAALAGGIKSTANEQTEDVVECALKEAEENRSAVRSIPPPSRLSVGLDLDFQADGASSFCF